MNTLPMNEGAQGCRAFTPEMKWPKDKPMLEPENELLYFSFQEDMDIPDNLPDWMIKTIKSSYEWQHRGKELPPPDTSGLPLEEGDIPF